MRPALLAILMLAACDRTIEEPPPDKTRIKEATMTVRKYAYEAYPQWAVVHVEKQCPAAIEELLEYTTAKTNKDPWGHAYRMMCGVTLPRGARGIAISSDGEDGKPDTADDVRSWD